MDKKLKPSYFSYFEKLYESWEQTTSRALQFWFENPILGNCVERAVEKSIEFKNYTQDIIERTLKYRYIPVKEDFINLMDSLDNLELKLNKLEEKLKDVQLSDQSKKDERKARTKKRRKSK